MNVCSHCDWKKPCLPLLEQRCLPWNQSFHKVWIICMYSCRVRHRFIRWICRASVLTQVIEALTEAAWRVSFPPWQGWAALGRGGTSSVHSLSHLEGSISAFYPAWVKCTHPSQPLPCFLPGLPTVFCNHFSPPTVAVSLGQLCCNITDTGWHSGSNE